MPRFADFILAGTLTVLSALPAMPADVRLAAPAAPERLRDALRAASLTVDLSKQADTTSADLVAAARADYARLVGVLYANGYYSPVIHIRVDGREAADLPPFAVPQSLENIEISIEPGPIFTFSRAEVAPLARHTALPEDFATGHTARSTLVVDAARAGVEGWRDQGHAKAEVSGQRVVADHRAQTLDARIALVPGPRLRFGDLVIESRNRTRPERIRAIAGLPEGEVFSPDELRRAANRLRRTGAFRSVTLREAERPNPDGTLDIEADLIDDRMRRLGFGAEISSVEGLRLSGFWMHRNLLRGAERFRAEFDVSGIGGGSGGEDYQIDLSLTRPATFTPDTDLNFFAEAALEDEPDYYEKRVQVGTSLTRRFSDELEVEAGLRLQYSRVRDDLGRRSFNLLGFPLSATWDRRDNTLNARDGFYIDAGIAPFLSIGGGASGARIHADARVYEDFGDRVVLAGRLQAGSVLNAGLAEVPPSMLFFSGGGGTVRGQPYKSLGVDLPGGETLGGRGFLGASAEIRVDVTDTIGVVGFADAGFIGADSTPGSGGEWHSGAGLGIRYNTGIGPIRLDVATPVGGNTGDGVQFYIGIGQAF